MSEELVHWAGFMVEDVEQDVAGLLDAKYVGSVVKQWRWTAAQLEEVVSALTCMEDLLKSSGSSSSIDAS